MRIKDIAKEAGVSTATVSHVINKTKFVSDETREKVLSAIEKFDFYPNAHARMLAMGRSNIIGLLISDISNPFFPELVKSIETAVFEHGYNLMLFNTNYDSPRKEYISGLDDVQDMNIQFQRVVDDAGQNLVRDASFASPRTTCYFNCTTGQGETMTFVSECSAWQVTGGADAVEMAQVTVRPRNIVWTGVTSP